MLFPEDFFEFRFQFVGAIAAGATVDNLSGGVDDDGCRESGDVETAGYAGGVALLLADVRPVHLEFLGEFLQLRQVVHAALNGYADEIQRGVALVNIHEFGNDGDAGLAPRSPEVKQRVFVAERDVLALDVLGGNGRGAEALVGHDGCGRVVEWRDADMALLAAEIDVEESENQTVEDDGELDFAQKTVL